MILYCETENIVNCFSSSLFFSTLIYEHWCIFCTKLMASVKKTSSIDRDEFTQ